LRKAGVRANSPAAQTARGPDPAFLNHHRPSQDGWERVRKRERSQKRHDAQFPVPEWSFSLPRWGRAGVGADPESDPDPDPKPFWLRRGAEGKTDQGRALFERSEFARTPFFLSTGGCP
jgi:hypothetical protein